MHKAPQCLRLRAAPAEPALTPSNCSRFPRRWSRPYRSQRSSPRMGASSRQRRRGSQPGQSHGLREARSAHPVCLLPPSLHGPGRRGSGGGAVGSSRLFPTPQPSSAARAGAGHAPLRGRGHFIRLPRAGPHRPGGHRLLGASVARDWLGRRGGAALAEPAARLQPRRGNPASHLGPGSSPRAGIRSREREREAISS